MTDPIVEANRTLLLQRSELGIRKYGTTLADAGLSQQELLQHLLEELLDAANYTQAALQSVTAIATSEQEARQKWNATADHLNQWDTLGQDEKDELTAAVQQEPTK